jgi:transcriptional regulator GlxA family with amidase domain
MAVAGQSLGERGFWTAQAALARVVGLLGGAVRQGDGTLLLPAEGPADESSRGVVEAADGYFRAHLGEKVSLASAARHLGMSSSALSHRYAEEAGQPPMAALTALRIELAKSLLLRGLKIETIAAQTGFFDAFHLSKVFKRHCGLSPSDFRRGFRPAGGRP